MEVHGWRSANQYLLMCEACGEYSLAEREQRWARGQGACGCAWEKDRQVFCVRPKDDSVPYAVHNMMTPTQKDVCRHVQSVLSTPVHGANGNIVAVINIDCVKYRVALEKTEVAGLAKVYALKIADLY